MPVHTSLIVPNLQLLKSSCSWILNFNWNYHVESNSIDYTTAFCTGSRHLADFNPRARHRAPLTCPCLASFTKHLHVSVRFACTHFKTRSFQHIHPEKKKNSAITHSPRICAEFSIAGSLPISTLLGPFSLRNDQYVSALRLLLHDTLPSVFAAYFSTKASWTALANDAAAEALNRSLLDVNTRATLSSHLYAALARTFFF